jgi:lipid-binding SYLF domain-containing protein
MNLLIARVAVRRGRAGILSRMVRIMARVLLAFFPLVSTAADVWAQTDQQALVDAAAVTLQNLLRDHPEKTSLQTRLIGARAVIIAPQIVRLSFVGGLAGGRAVLVARVGDNWQGPVFYDIDSASFGFQIGFAVSEVVMLVMTEQGLKSLLQDSTHVSRHQGWAVVGAGTTSSNVEAAQAGAMSDTEPDKITFSSPKGFYSALSLEHVRIRSSEQWNRIYNGRPMMLADFLVPGTTGNPQAEGLLRAIADAARAK